ncbi:MAG: HAD-IIA family hydrolase [Acutalibacteraceae bacterium]|jgi:HAD superfamily hydrolase (TIGR01450 family)
MTQKELFAKVKYFIIDMDGTFYLDNHLIDGSLDFIEKLKTTGRDFCFFTNNSSNNVTVCAEKLKKMGFPVPDGKIVISTHVAIDYIKINYTGKKIFLLGNERLEADFANAGLPLVKDEPDLVVLGFDTTLTYQKLWDAVRFLDKGAVYIATHPDMNCPTADGYMPDTGSMIELLAASTGRRPLIMGKPSTFTVDYLTRLLKCEREALAFVGDRLATDIAIGAKHSIVSALVLTGVTTAEEHELSSIRADAVVERLSDLADYLD